MFLETKLHPPRTKPSLLVRDRLLALIHDNLDKRLVAVISGAGYGKTTLIGQLMEREQLPAVFIALEPSDSDPASFIHYLMAGLLRLAGADQRSTIDQSLRSALELMRDDASLPGNPIAFATTLINKLASHRAEELFIVLDDYHWLDPGSQVHAMVDFLVDRMPASLHLIICSRVPLPLPSLSKWRSKQDAFELDQADLAFEATDLRALIEGSYRASLPDAELARVLEQTRGWITGIHLIMQAAGMHKSVKESLNGYVAANRPLFEYFASEILGKEDGAARDFLLETSVLEVMSGPACDYMLESSGSARLLQDLEHRNVFIVESARGEYRHHPLFHNYLRDNFTDAGRRRALHARAGAFFQHCASTELAIDHFIQAETFDRAAGLIVGIHDEYIGTARFDALGRWFARLPEDIYPRFPQLLLPLARWHLEQHRPEAQKAALKRAVALLDLSGDRRHYCQALLCQSDILIRERRPGAAVTTLMRGIRLCPASVPQLKTNLYNKCGQAWLWQGRYASAGTYYRKALRFARSAGLPFGDRVKIGVDLCVLHSREGDYRTAFRRYRSLISHIKPDHYYLGIGALYGSAAKAALTVGDIAAAESFLVRGRTACQQHRDVQSTAMLAIIGAQLDFFWSRWDRAEGTLKQLERTCSSMGGREWLEAVCRNRAQLCRYQNRLAEAQQILDSIDPRGWSGAPPRNYMVLRGLSEKGYLEAATGRMAEARKTAAVIAKAAQRLGDRLGAYYAQMVFAMSRLDRPAQARPYFDRAMAMARQWGYEGLLALELGNNAQLRQLYDSATSPDKHRHRLALLLSPPPTPKPEVRRPLSVRLFGQVELRSPSGRAVAVPWRTRKVLSLFGYLAVNRERFCYIEELVGALWPRTDLGKAKQQLYQAVSMLKDNLRKGFSTAGMPEWAAADPVVHQSQSYQLSPLLELELDTEAFERLWREHIQFAASDDPPLAERCRQALALHRDAFMVATGDAWSEERREHYYKLCLMVQEKLARRLLAAHQPLPAIEQYAAYLRKEPFAEHVRLQYWKALLAVGNRRQVQQDHAHYSRLIRQELGQPPGAEIIAFLRSLP